VQLGYSDDEMFALMWCARQKRVPLGDVVQTYGECNRSLAQVCTRYGILPASYYVEVDEKCDMAIRYKHLYIAHWSKRTTVHEYTNDEVISLLHLRFANEYYGIPSDEYLHRATRGETFQYICLSECHRAGTRKVDCRGEQIVVVQERPWACKSHDEWVQKQQVWMKQRELNNREREVSERERDVAKREADAEYREREAKMHEEQARHREQEAKNAQLRAEHDRQVAEYERMRANQAKERELAERQRLEHERQMAEYDRKKADLFDRL
jgi:hypothetical protein